MGTVKKNREANKKETNSNKEFTLENLHVNSYE